MSVQLLPADNHAGVVIPTRRRNSPWLYKHHASDWECVQTKNGWEWLPGLSRYHLKGGVGGAKALRRNGRTILDDTGARKNHRILGWQIIEADNAAHPNYIRAVRTQTGFLHVDVWTSVKAVGRKLFMKKPDREAFNDFRRSLVEEGVVAPPDPDIIEGIVSMARHRSRRGQDRAHMPGVAARLKKNLERYENIRLAASEAPSARVSELHSMSAAAVKAIAKALDIPYKSKNAAIPLIVEAEDGE